MWSPPPAAEGLVAELERASETAHPAFLRQLRRYREVYLWSVTLGDRSPLDPPYLSQDSRLERCGSAQEVLSIRQAVLELVVSGDRGRGEVKWDRCKQYDLRGLAAMAPRLAQGEAEAQGGIQREIALQEHYGRMSDFRGPGDGAAP